MNITVENIKCGGCAGTITKKINAEIYTPSVKGEGGQGIAKILARYSQGRDERSVDVEVKLDSGIMQTLSVKPF
jgi:copper chaperone CopZ